MGSFNSERFLVHTFRQSRRTFSPSILGSNQCFRLSLVWRSQETRPPLGASLASPGFCNRRTDGLFLYHWQPCLLPDLQTWCGCTQWPQVSWRRDGCKVCDCLLPGTARSLYIYLLTVTLQRRKMVSGAGTPHPIPKRWKYWTADSASPTASLAYWTLVLSSQLWLMVSRLLLGLNNHHVRTQTKFLGQRGHNLESLACRAFELALCIYIHSVQPYPSHASLQHGSLWYSYAYLMPSNAETDKKWNPGLPHERTQVMLLQVRIIPPKNATRCVANPGYKKQQATRNRAPLYITVMAWIVRSWYILQVTLMTS